MGDETQVVTQDEPELCIIKLPTNKLQLGDTKQELVVVTSKTPQLEKRSGLCGIKKIVIQLQTTEEMKKTIRSLIELYTCSITTKLPTTTVHCYTLHKL